MKFLFSALLLGFAVLNVVSQNEVKILVVKQEVVSLAKGTGAIQNPSSIFLTPQSDISPGNRLITFRVINESKESIAVFLAQYRRSRDGDRLSLASTVDRR